MKLNVVNTTSGFIPEKDSDYELKKKLKTGVVYEVTIKEVRNVKFHHLYFSLLNCAWAYLTDKQQEFFHDNIESFRKTVEIAAGHYEPVYSTTRKQWLEVPKSIAFDKLSESDFSALYEKVRDVLYTVFIPEVNKVEFEKNLAYF